MSTTISPTRATGGGERPLGPLTPEKAANIPLPPELREHTFENDADRLNFTRGFIGGMARGVEDGRYTLTQVAVSLRYLLGELS